MSQPKKTFLSDVAVFKAQTKATFFITTFGRTHFKETKIKAESKNL